jgi:hypothetical protein
MAFIHNDQIWLRQLRASNGSLHRNNLHWLCVVSMNASSDLTVRDIGTF